MKKQLVGGLSYFTESYRKPVRFPPLQTDISTDVVIAGGGVTGALCAYYLSAQNINAVLVEKNEIAAGSTSVSTSLLQYELDQLIQDLEKKYPLSKIIRGYRFADKGRTELDSLIGKLGLDCDFQPRSCLTFTNDKNKADKLKYEYEQRLANGFDVEFIDSKSNNCRFSFDIEAGVHARNGGGEVNPVKLTNELVMKAAQMGCEIYEGTEIKEYTHFDDHVEVCTSDNKTLRCKKLIVATGYDISAFTSKKYCTLYTSYNVVTSPVENICGWQGRCLIKTAEDTYTYLRTTPDNRIIIGGEDTRFIPKFLEDNVAGQKYGKLEESLKEIFPRLDCHIEYGYYGIFGSTEDNLPYIGPDPKNKNIWYCLGYGANGILFSVNGARMLSKLYFGFSDDDLDLVALDRN